MTTAGFVKKVRGLKKRAFLDGGTLRFRGPHGRVCCPITALCLDQAGGFGQTLGREGKRTAARRCVSMSIWHGSDQRCHASVNSPSSDCHSAITTSGDPAGIHIFW